MNKKRPSSQIPSIISFIFHYIFLIMLCFEILASFSYLQCCRMWGKNLLNTNLSSYSGNFSVPEISYEQHSLYIKLCMYVCTYHQAGFQGDISLRAMARQLMCRAISPYRVLVHPLQDTSLTADYLPVSSWLLALKCSLPITLDITEEIRNC